MTRWGQSIDDLAGAVADLLSDASVPSAPLADAAATLACRDAVVVQLRQLVGALADMPPVAQARPLQMFDITERPAQALQQALAELPRASEFGTASVSTYFEQGLAPYEQRWRDAARASVGLEIFVEALGQVPDQHSWAVLRDLADLAAAIPALDHDLSEAILSCLKSGMDLPVSYAVLIHPAHDAVRVCANEIRSRVPAVPPATAPPPSVPVVLAAGELDQAMDRCVRTVLGRAGDLSLGDLRAVTRLLQSGSTQAAVVLARAERAVPGAHAVAAGLRSVASLAEQLRDSPTKTLGPDRLDALRASSDLIVRMAALGKQERVLPGGASDAALRRLATPALEFAKHVPNLARALDLGVREALLRGLMLVPSAATERNSTSLLWMPAGRGSGRPQDGVPTVRQHAHALAAAAEPIGPAVRAAQVALEQHQMQVVDPASLAAAQARSHVGAARAQLRAVLGQQAGAFPPPLSSPLPRHPRLAPDGPISGRLR